jgi:hypothetical protein
MGVPPGRAPFQNTVLGNPDRERRKKLGEESRYNMSVSYSYRIRDKSFVNPELACNLVAACDPVLSCPVLFSLPPSPVPK